MSKPAAVQYLGSEASKSCIDAVRRLIQYGDSIEWVRLLSCDHDHALLLVVDGYQLIVVRPGFTSGYAGEGPRTFAKALRRPSKGREAMPSGWFIRNVSTDRQSGQASLKKPE